MLKWLNLQRKWLAWVAIVIISLSILLFYFWQRAQKAEQQYPGGGITARILSRADDLAKALHISELHSKELQAAYEKELHRPPATGFTLQAPSLQAAAEQVVERINKQDTSLPPEALDQTNRTAVVKNDKEVQGGCAEN